MFQNKIYKISPAIAFKSPVYVHSHESSLLQSQKMADQQMQNTFGKVQSEIKKIYDTSLQQAKNISQLISIPTKELKDLNVGPDNLFGDAYNIFQEYIQPLRKNIKQGKIKTYLTQQEVSEALKILSTIKDEDKRDIWTILEEQLSMATSDIVINQLKVTLNNAIQKKSTKKTINSLPESVEDINIKVLKKIFPARKKNELSQSNSTIKTLTKKIKMNPEQESNFIMSYLDNYLKIVKNRNIDMNNYKIVKASIEEIKKQATTVYQKLGALNEGQVLLSINSAVNGHPVQSTLVGKTDHDFTSDILLKIDEIYKSGISVKLNPDRLAGRNIELLNTNSSSKEGEALNKWIKSSIGGESVRNILLYYLINYEALRTFAVGFNDTKLRRSLEGEMKIEELNLKDYSGTKYGIYNILEDIRKSVFLGLITRLLLGPIFGLDLSNFNTDIKIQALKESKGMPLMLIAGDSFYWTEDILNNCINIIEDIQTKKQESSYNFRSFYFYADQNIFKRKSDLKEALLKLYLAKIKSPDGEENANRYEELKQDPAVYMELLNIQKLMGFDDNKNVSSILLKKWGLRYDYSNLQK